MAKGVDWNLRDEDLEGLKYLLDEKNRPELTPAERKAFGDMLVGLLHKDLLQSLSRKQRLWVKEVVARVKPIDASKVPRGKEVVTPLVLRNLPLKPPGRR